MTLRELRKHIGLNQTKAGELLGMTPQAWSQLETGKYTPSQSTIEQICEAFECHAIVTGSGTSFVQGKYVDEKLVIPISTEEDLQYYTRMGWDIVEKGDIHYVTTNDILLSILDFVQKHNKIGNRLQLSFTSDQIKISIEQPI